MFKRADGVPRTGRIRTIVFDQEPLWRRTLASMLERRVGGRVEICHTLEELEATLTDEPPPRLLVADPGEETGFDELLHELRPLVPELTTVVVWRGRNHDGRHAELAAAGVAAFIRKESEVELIERVLHETMAAQIRLARLTPREVEILALVAAGHSNREVAARLWLSDQTVKFHLANIYRRLGVTGRAEAVAVARSEGLLPAAPTLPVLGTITAGEETGVAAV